MDEVLTPTPEEQALIDAEFTSGGSCACDGYFDPGGCPACNQWTRQKWLEEHRALWDQAQRIIEALCAKPKVRAVVEKKLGVHRRAGFSQQWEPEGFSLHLSREDLDAFVAGEQEYKARENQPVGEAQETELDERMYWLMVFRREDWRWGRRGDPWRKFGMPRKYTGNMTTYRGVG